MLDFLTNINIAFYIIAYFFGALPFGYLIVRSYKINLLEIGSGSIGATNVYRALKDKTPRAKALAIATIALDSSKGLVVVLAAKILGASFETQWMIVLLSVIGHCYSPFLGFRGGKGVATTIGAVILLVPVEGIIGLFAWLICGKVFKISSLSSLVGVSLGILSSFLLPALPENISITAQISTRTPLILLLLLILYTHFPNIVRLIKKQERSIFE